MVSQPPSLPNRAPAVDLGVQADALYDYQAAEANELNLRAGDRITNIEFVSDDWWQGRVDGLVGLCKDKIEGGGFYNNFLINAKYSSLNC